MTRTGRIAVRAALVAVAAAWVVLPQSARAQDETASGPITLQTQISGESNTMLSSVVARLEGADERVAMQNQLADTSDARTAFVAGDADMIISGVGFTDREVDDLKKSGRGVISAPVQATALAMFGFIPAPATGSQFPTAQAWLRAFPQRCAELDEEGESDCSIADLSAFTGPFRVTPSALGQMIFAGRNIFGTPEFMDNQDPAAVGGRLIYPPADIARPVVRSGADATNYYLERYVQATQPDAWKLWMAATPGQSAATQPTEAWPVDSAASRRSMDDVVSLIREGLSGSDSILNFSGAFSFVPPGKVTESMVLNVARPADQQIPLYAAVLRNGAGEWVSPTPDAITAAMDAGEGAPLTGATTAVPGAYPITWVNRLYAPASGLTAGQANAIATIIRTQVTTGRAAAAQQGDGRITPKMVAEALAAADKIVVSNCTSAGGEVVDSKDGAPYAPAGAITGVSSMKLCDPPAKDVAADPSSGDLSAGDASYGDLGSGDDGYGDLSSGTPLETITESGSFDDIAGGGGGAGGGAGGGDGAAAAISRRMPMGLPTLGLSPLDRVVTLALGALTFVVIRNFATGRTRAA